MCDINPGWRDPVSVTREQMNKAPVNQVNQSGLFFWNILIKGHRDKAQLDGVY